MKRMTQIHKKICFLLPYHWTFGFGGAEYQVKCIIDELIKKRTGIEIYYITRGYQENYRPNQYRIVKGSNENFLNRYADFFDGPSLLTILNKIKPDIIYQRVGGAYTGYSAYYAMKKKAKMIWHIAHDSDVQPLKSGPYKTFIFRFIDKKLLEFGIKHSNIIIAQSGYQKRELLKYYDKKVSAIIPNFHPYPNEITNKVMPLKVLWVANMKPWKRPELFIDLARKFKNRKDVKFIMVGAPLRNKNRQNEIENEINKIDNLTYYGSICIDKVNRLIAKSHVFVNTSTQEGFPNTFIQAWMRKTPVISLSVNPDNILRLNKTGFYSETFQQLEKDLAMLLNNVYLRDKLGENAQRYALKHHSLNNVNLLINYFR